jgi:phosphate transport system substrate-binding protein
MGGSDIWNENLAEFADRPAMIAALAKDRYGIAYTGLCYATPDVKPLAIAEQDGGPFVPLTKETVASRAYPLSRPVYLYFAPDTPGGEPANPKVDPKVRRVPALHPEPPGSGRRRPRGRLPAAHCGRRARAAQETQLNHR